MADRSEILSRLWEKSNGKCMRCGRPLTREDHVVNHIFPKAYGGSDDLFNLRLLCTRCDRALVFRPVRVLFEQYLQQLLLHDPRFENVRAASQVELANGEKASFDFLFTRTVQGRTIQYVVEAKFMTVATAREVSSAIGQLTYYKNNYSDAQFILAIPTVLAEEYQQQLHSAGVDLWDRDTLRRGIPDIPLPAYAASDIYDELLDRLRHCPPGRENWQVYQKLVGEILTVLFCPPLDPISEQNADATYSNRRDYVIPNYAECGYWKELRYTYQAEFIVIDAKNAADTVGKEDILQVAHYLKEKGPGMFGLIFSRYGTDDSGEQHLRDIWQNQSKMIIVLDDSDVEQMLLSKQANNDPCRLIITKIQEFRLRI